MLSISSADLDTIFEALGSKKRRGIIETLAYRPATVRQLSEEHQLTLPAIHRHIRVLEEAKLIRRKKVGRTNFVAFNHAAMELAQTWVAQFNTAWGSDTQTLENYIASMEHRT